MRPRRRKEFESRANRSRPETNRWHRGFRAMRLLTLGIALVTLHSYAQAQAPSTPTPAARLTFEVASIKRNVSGDPGASIRIQPGGQMTVTNNSLLNLIRNAYGSQRYEMV